jgi:AcrR family transcriptional regulator
VRPVERDARAEKRAEIVRSTWRLIAEHGLGAANMRSLARAAGYANGALAYYFAGKDDLIHAAFSHVVARTEERMADAARAHSGLRGLLAVCDEMLPLDAERRREARIVLPFWEIAQHDPSYARLHRRSLRRLTRQLEQALGGAAQSGQLRRLSPVAQKRLVAQLTAAMLGAQVLALLSPSAYPPAVLRELVRSCIAPFRTG